MSTCPITGDPECKCKQIVTVLQGNLNIKEALRKLFSEHAYYTWLFIDTFRLPGNGDITNRLLKNQQDIGDALGKVLGNTQLGNQLTQLLQDHIKGAAGAVTALYDFGPDSKELKAAIDKVLANSKQVAEFLSKLSPKLPFETVHAEFDQHNQYVVNIATAHYKKEYVKEIGIADEYYTHMLKFSDMLAAALAKDEKVGGACGGGCPHGCGCGGDNYKGKYIKYKSKYLKNRRH